MGREALLLRPTRFDYLALYATESSSPLPNDLNACAMASILVGCRSVVSRLTSCGRTFMSRARSAGRVPCEIISLSNNTFAPTLGGRSIRTWPRLGCEGAVWPCCLQNRNPSRCSVHRAPWRVLVLGSGLPSRFRVGRDAGACAARLSPDGCGQQRHGVLKKGGRPLVVQQRGSRFEFADPKARPGARPQARQEACSARAGIAWVEP